MPKNPGSSRGDHWPITCWWCDLVPVFNRSPLNSGRFLHRLAESAAEFFPNAVWQRCIVHWYRNVFSHVPSTKVREIAAMHKAIHASEDGGGA